VLALRHELIPATLNFATANPELNLEDSPFRVIAEATPWPANASPRRAGVSAFGLGGTNAHVILEEAPPQAALAEPDEAELLVLSAKTEPALNRLSVAMADYLETDDETPLADIAHTLQVGRQAMGVRRALVCRDRQAAAATLRKTIAPELITALALDPMPRPVFMFPGQGSQRAGMGASIYAAERVFREAVDRCAAILEPLWKLDVRELMFGRVADADRLLTETRYTQPALFTIEYALARQWMHWGLRPVALVGHSIGEFVAATVADIMRLEDALPLVAERGRLMQEQPGGGMLSIRLPESELAPWLGEGIELAGVNAPRLCVVAGSHAAVDALGKRLDEAEVAYSRLHTSHAFHSDSMAPVVEPFRERVAALKLSTPAIPVISTVTGQPLADEEATDPQYWARQLRLPVRFHSAVSHLLDSASALFLEVGPGLAASTFARQAAAEKSGAPVVESLGRPDPEVSEHDKLLQAAGGVWARGVPLDWQRMRQGPRRHRVPLPMYSFERTRYWLETTGVRSQPETEEVAETRSAPIDPAASGASVMEQLQAALREATGLGADTLPPAGRFSELGLDSLFLTQFSQLLRQRFHLELRLRDLLGAYDNLAALASLIEEQTRAAPAAAPATGNGHANAPARGTPPRPDARLGRRPDGRPAWFIPDPERPGAYRELRADT
ncbi:MAG: acyltransferase domain-containing protein, partial [Gammaproteobacteria bacterium]|jgi:acyl transferase domain-containing protein